MRQRIGQKLRSRSGASLMMALLLFLVCAVMGSVVLAAATTTNKVYFTVESDQRYYALSSAAELLRSRIQDKTVRVRRTPDPDGAGPATETVEWFLVEDGTELTGDGGAYLLPDDLAKALAIAAVPDVTWITGDYTITTTGSFLMKACRDDDSPIATLPVKVSVTTDSTEKRTMTLCLQNADVDGNVISNAASLYIKCTADILREELPMDGSEEKIVTYTVSWRITDVSRWPKT